MASWTPKKSWLEHQYLDLRRSTSVIAQECNRATSNVFYWLYKFEIPTRSRPESHASWSNYVSLSSEALEFLRGELLGDGHLERIQWSSSYRHNSKHKEYLEWLSKELARFGINQSGKVLKHEATSCCKGKTFQYTSFSYQSRYYIDLKLLWQLWYRPAMKEEKDRGRRFIKVVPKDLELTSLVLRQWYLGDGYPQYYRNKRNGLGLSTQGFSRREVRFLADLLENLGLTASVHADNEIYVFARSVNYFLDYIGPCPKEIRSIFGYKWNEWRD